MMKEQRVERIGRFAFAVSIAVVLLGFANVTTPSDLSAASPAAVEVPFRATMAFDCDVDCGENHCAGGWHEAWETTPAFYFWHRAGGVHLNEQCEEGTCATTHGPECAVGGLELERLRTSIVAGETAAIAAIARANPSQVTINERRSAIQIANCRGEVVVHLPMSAALTSAVAAATETLPPS